MPVSIGPRQTPRTLPVRRPEDLPPPPLPSQQCRDGHPLIDDWRKSQDRIEAVEEQARVARKVALGMTLTGAVGMAGGIALMAGFGATFPVGLATLLIGTGLVVAADLVRNTVAGWVAGVNRRAEDSYARAERLCRSLQ